MNERIFELAKEADLIQWDTLPSGARTPDHESVVKARKFAELIVRECVESMQVNLITETQPVPGTMDYIQNHTINLCANTVKKHFGVEE
jgi:hypothetical protein